MLSVNKKLTHKLLPAILFVLILAGMAGLLFPANVYAAGGDITISGPGLNNPGPDGIIITQDQLRGEEPLPPGLQALYGYEYLQQHDEWYSTINTWPTKSWYRGVGVKLGELFDLAGGLKPGATQVKFTSKDDFSVAFTVQDFICAEHYRFPNFMNTGQAGHLPGDLSGAVPVEAIIAHRSSYSGDIEDITGPGADDNLNRNEANHLLFGQRTVTQQANARFAKYVAKIEVLIDPAPQWEKPTASVAPGGVQAGTQVRLSAPFNDEDKVHYTLDGSDPTMESSMYNWVASRWWSSRGGELDEINCPIVINGDTIIKALVSGPGRLDSEIATFEYTVPNVGVTGVSIAGGNQEVERNRRLQLTAEVEPEDATNRIVTWSSTDEAVATVDGDGLVTALEAGTADITVTTADGGFTDCVTITVILVPATGVSIGEGNRELNVGSTVGLTAVVKPDNATNRIVTWSSSDETVATVNESGLVSAKSSGTAEITVTTEDGSFTDTIIITVKTGSTTPGLKSPPSLTSNERVAGQEVELTFTDNAEWRGNITGVSIDGAALSPDKYDTANTGRIIIHAGVFTASGSFNIIIGASGYDDAAVTQKIIEGKIALTITGAGIGRTKTFTQAELGAMPQHQEVYSSINTWPSKRWYVGKGVRLQDLLDAAGGIKGGATLAKVTSTDGYYMTFTVQELINSSRYRFPNFKTGGDADGHIPGNPSGAVPVDTILGLVCVEGSNDPADMTKGDALLLMMGQRAVTEQTGPLFVKNVNRLEMLTESVSKWEMPTARPLPGEVAAGTLVELHAASDDMDKVHYTTDGSTPTLNSPMYNPLAKRWYSTRGDEAVAEINKPIKLTKDTTIKAIVIGPGHADSDVATFTYKVTPAKSSSSSEIRPDEGGTVSLDDEAIIKLPAGALPAGSAVEVKIERVEKPPAFPAGFRLLGDVFEFSIGSKKSYDFSKEVTITFAFDPTVLARGEIPSICYYDETLGGWVSLGGEVADNTITVKVNHFTKFAVMATLPATVAAAIKPDAGGKVELGDGAFMEIPAGALTGSKAVDVMIKRLDKPPAAAPMGFKQLGSTYLFTIDGKDSYNFAKKVVIGLALNPEEIGKGQSPAIHYYDEAKKAWVNLGGKTLDKTIRIEIDHLSSYAVMVSMGKTEAKLSDIAGHWAETGIIELLALGAISGYPDGTFRPDRNITRAEFVTVLVKAFQPENQGGEPFTDTAHHWAGDYIARAVAAGIAGGYGDNTFRPDELITREQMAAMIAVAAKVPAAKGALSFTDSKSISPWAREAIAATAENGIIKGYPDNTFRPQGGATRAEAVTVIINALYKYPAPVPAKGKAIGAILPTLIYGQ